MCLAKKKRIEDVVKCLCSHLFPDFAVGYKPSFWLAEDHFHSTWMVYGTQTGGNRAVSRVVDAALAGRRHLDSDKDRYASCQFTELEDFYDWCISKF